MLAREDFPGRSPAVLGARNNPTGLQALLRPFSLLRRPSYVFSFVNPQEGTHNDQVIVYMEER